MAKRRTRLIARGTAVIAALALVAVAAVSVVVVKLRAPDCVVSADGREVELDQDQAVAVSRAVAAVVRGSGTANEAAAAVLDHLDLEVEDALLVGNAFSGRARAAVVCHDGGASDGEVDRLGADGLTGRAEAVRDDLETRFGDLPLGGFAPGGVTDGHMPGSAHYE